MRGVVLVFVLAAAAVLCVSAQKSHAHDKSYQDAIELESIWSRSMYGPTAPSSHAKHQRVELIHKFLKAFQAPVVAAPRTPAPSSLDGARRPVVLMHGLGDAGSNAGMQSLAQSVTAKFPGTYAVAVDVADGLDSFFTLISDQIDQFASYVKSDPKLAGGFNAVGLSQGGLIIRGYVERYNDPPVFNAVSICGPQNGVGSCPAGTPDFICDIFKLGPYTASLSFAGYWKEVADEATYLKESTLLADINNERDAKNQSYVQQLTSLNKYVLIMAENDTVVEPRESEQHGFWKWGDTTHSQVQLLRDTESFQQDWLGLQTLFNSSRLDMASFPGEHIRFSDQFWENTVMPYFDNAPAADARTEIALS